MYTYSVWLLVYLAVSCAKGQDNRVATANGGRPAGKEAYVTILYMIKDETYQEGFEIGVRVLGQSLRESKTDKEYVVLCTKDVPEATRKVLAVDGWTVKMMDGLEKGEIKHFNAFFLKLHVWLLEEYRRVVYLDSDTVVVRNVDELFRCGSFCATYRHSDLFNAGVMVFKPSVAHHYQLKHLPCPRKKRRCDDQILLNIHYDILKYASLFNGKDPRYHEEPLRLPWKYNADIGMYYLNSQWLIPELKIIHFTLGPLKPMQWWTYPLFDQNWIWNEYRERLPFRFNEPSMYSLFNLMPFVILLLLFLSMNFLQNRCLRFLVSYSIIKRSIMLFVPGEKGWIASVAPIVLQTVANIWAFHCVPTNMRPKEAWAIFGIWMIFFVILQYTIYCSFLFVAFEHSKNLRRVKSKTAILLFFFICLYIVQTCVPYNFTGNFAIVQRLVFMIFLIFVSYMYGYIAGRCLLRLWGSCKYLNIIY